MPTLKGLTLAEQPLREQFGRVTGYRTYRTFKGTEGEIKNLYEMYKANGATCEIEGGAVWSLQVDIAGEDPEFSWEILNEVKGVDILNTDLLRGISAENVMIITNSIDNYEGGTLTIPSFTGDATQIALAKKGWRWKIRGLNEINTFVQVLRSTYVVYMDYEITNANTNIDKVHKTETMVNVEDIPSRMWNALMQSSTVNYPETVNGETFTYTYDIGWLKGPPQVTHTGKNKIQIVQEYRHGAYAEDVFGAMI